MEFDPLIVVLSVIWILGGQLFTDMIVGRDIESMPEHERHLYKERFSDKVYFTITWPFLVLITCIRV